MDNWLNKYYVYNKYVDESKNIMNHCENNQINNKIYWKCKIIISKNL